MTAETPKSPEQPQPELSLKASLEALTRNEGESYPVFVGRLGVLGSRFPDDALATEALPLLESHLENWSLEARVIKGTDAVVGNRYSNWEFKPSAIEVDDLQELNGEDSSEVPSWRRKVWPRDRTLVLAVIPALTGADIRAITDIERRIIDHLLGDDCQPVPEAFRTFAKPLPGPQDTVKPILTSPV